MSDDPLKNIVFISLPENNTKVIEELFDPKILLPIEMNPQNGMSELKNLSIEMIIAAILKLFAYNPEHDNIDYYGKLVDKLRPNILSELTEAAILKVNEKDFSLAEEIFIALINFKPDNLILKQNLALVYEQHGDAYTETNNTELSTEYYEKAFNCYKELSQKKWANENFHFNYGLFLFKRENFNKAKEHFTNYIEISSDKKRTKYIKELLSFINSKTQKKELFHSAFDNMKLGKVEQAIKDIKLFIKDDPNVWTAWFILGWAYRKKEMYKEAIDAFYKAIDLGSKETDLYNEMAICMMEISEYEKSKKYLLKALRIEPDNIKFLSNLGILCIKENNDDEARKYFKMVLDINPNDKIASEFIDSL